MSYLKDRKKLPYSEWTEEEQSKHKEHNKKYREKNKDEILEKAKKYYEENKDKRKEYHKKRYEENKDRILEQHKRYREENKDKRKEYNKKWLADNRDRSVFLSIRTRARKLDIPFDLELDDITSYDTCPIFGFKMERGGCKDSRSSPSVDKIIPSKGYVKGNIQVISNKANRMKNDATPEELRMFAKWVLKTFPEEPDVQT